jgi:hypothetical protein
MMRVLCFADRCSADNTDNRRSAYNPDNRRSAYNPDKWLKEAFLSIQNILPEQSRRFDPDFANVFSEYSKVTALNQLILKLEGKRNRPHIS